MSRRQQCTSRIVQALPAGIEAATHMLCDACTTKNGRANATLIQVAPHKYISQGSGKYGPFDAISHLMYKIMCLRKMIFSRDFATSFPEEILLCTACPWIHTPQIELVQKPDFRKIVRKVRNRIKRPILCTNGFIYYTKHNKLN